MGLKRIRIDRYSRFELGLCFLDFAAQQTGLSLVRNVLQPRLLSSSSALVARGKNAIDRRHRPGKS